MKLPQVVEPLVDPPKIDGTNSGHSCSVGSAESGKVFATLTSFCGSFSLCGVAPHATAVDEDVIYSCSRC
jgi:hypothetical protein